MTAKATPHTLKLRGTSRPGRLPGKAQPLGKPIRPGWLDRVGLAEWKRLTRNLQRLGLVAEVDSGMLAAIAERWSLYRYAQKALRDAINQGAEPSEVKHLDNVAMRAYKAYINGVARFGISPQSRSGLIGSMNRPGDDQRGQGGEDKVFEALGW